MAWHNSVSRCAAGAICQVDDNQSERDERPSVYRFAREDGSGEMAYVRTSVSFALVVAHPRVKFALPSKTDLEREQTVRDQNAYDLSDGRVNRSSYVASATSSLSISCDNVKLGWQQLGLIDASGARIYDGPISLEIREGARSESCVHHFPATTGTDDEHVYVSLWLQARDLEALVKTLRDRPECIASAELRLPGYERGGYWFGRKGVYIEPERAIGIADFSITITEAETSGSVEIDRARSEWLKGYRANLTKDDVRLASAVECGVNAIAASLAKSGDKPGGYQFALSEQFVSQLDSDLRIYSGSPFKNDKTLWKHLNFRDFLGQTTAAQRGEFYEPGDAIREYLSSPRLRNDYFDWLVLDVIVAQKLTALFELFMQQKHGTFAYGMVGNVWWKLLLVKMVTVPLSFVFGWVLPAVGFYFLARWSLWVGVALAALYYGVSIFLLARWLWFKALALLPGRPSLRRRLISQIEQLENIYSLLSGPVIHAGLLRSTFDRSVDKGVLWDQSVFYILDGVAQRNPQPWRNLLHTDMDLREALQNFENNS